MDSLVSKTSRKIVRQTLDTLPQSLDATYEEAILRIEQVLLWISFAVRPLFLDELREALAVQPHSRELDNDNMLDGDLLTSVCAGLVVVDRLARSSDLFITALRNTLSVYGPRNFQ